MKALMRILIRDLRISLRQGSDIVVVVMFFVITVALFPFGVGPEGNTLAQIAAGVVMVCAMLATLLSLDRMFLNDYEDGSLEQLEDCKSLGDRFSHGPCFTIFYVRRLGRPQRIYLVCNVVERHFYCL